MGFVAIPASKSHCCFRRDSVHAALLPSPGNPLAQEIMSLYQEPDGTRRLLNYLLDNLAGAIKRSESLSLLCQLWVRIATFISDGSRLMALEVVGRLFWCHNQLFCSSTQYQQSSPQLGLGSHFRNQTEIGHQVSSYGLYGLNQSTSACCAYIVGCSSIVLVYLCFSVFFWGQILL